MNAKKSNTIASIIANLSCEAVDSKPVTVDWEDVAKRAEDEPYFTEASRCEKCGAAVVGSYGDRHSNIDDESECDGHVPMAEGPMMNYFYPVDLDDAEEAARTLADTCLCVATIDGKTGLALTGGGMDLSWEICAAFVALGFLPPLHFCELPKMAGKDLASKKNRTTVAACLKSCKVAAGWANRGAERIRDMMKIARAEAKAAKAAKKAA